VGRVAPLIELDSAAPGAVDGRHIRAVTFHDVRMEYVARTMRLGRVMVGRKALVVGGIRGDLPRGLARLGFDVTSLDPSPAATALALAHPDRLGITYATAPAESLGVAGGGFDVVYCADTFEVTRDVDAVVGQIAAALAPGGVLIYDTVNRTPVSRLIYLGLFQAVPATRIMPPHRYAADRLRAPAELAEVFARHGLRGAEVVGFKPESARKLLAAVLSRRRGAIGDEEIASVVEFALDPGGAPLVTYLGHALKP
jgi:2-polyprenyl-6-hydroxyphenyl methylase / 3-demethylubiquinone-9 3-methyltransferase